METLENKISVYEDNSDLFKSFFGKDAFLYWDIFLLHYQDGVSYAKLGALYSYSASQIARIVKTVDEFLLEPEHFRLMLCLADTKFDGEAAMPNIFLERRHWGVYSLGAENILFLGVALVQRELPAIIIRERLLQLGNKYRNKKERDKLVGELLEMKFMVDDKYYSNIFEKVEDVKGNIILEFSLLAQFAIIQAKISYQRDAM